MALAGAPPRKPSSPSGFAAVALELASGAFGALSGLLFHVDDDLAALAARGEALRAERLHTLRLQGVDGLVA